MEIFYLCARNKIKITKNKLICSRKQTLCFPSQKRRVPERKTYGSATGNIKKP